MLVASVLNCIHTGVLDFLLGFELEQTLVTRSAVSAAVSQTSAKRAPLSIHVDCAACTSFATCDTKSYTFQQSSIQGNNSGKSVPPLCALCRCIRHSQAHLETGMHPILQQTHTPMHSSQQYIQFVHVPNKDKYHAKRRQSH